MLSHDKAFDNLQIWPQFLQPGKLIKLDIAVQLHNTGTQEGHEFRYILGIFLIGNDYGLMRQYQ